MDGDYVLWDSHAITPYLADQYGKDDALYPKDLKKRSTVNQRLHLDNATVAPVLRGIAVHLDHYHDFGDHKCVFFHQRPILFGRSKSVPDEKINEANEVYALLNKLLQKTKYIADNNVTIADFHLISLLSSLNVLVPIEEAKHSRLAKWFKEITALPCYQANLPGLQQFQSFIKLKLES